MHDERSPGPLAPPSSDETEAPPFGRSWGPLYAAVLGFLAVLIGLFLIFTRVFS
ncbi:MAG TPA: hypothetical protein VMS93_12610 [Candidatus Saccharimonadales bacterium]|nr:hypothetical protein [Candidatus Saccharimonadales bacterium]